MNNGSSYRQQRTSQNKNRKTILQTIWKPSTVNGVENHSRKHTTDKYTAHQNAIIMHNWKKQITEYGNTDYKKENNSVTNQWKTWEADTSDHTQIRIWWKKQYLYGKKKTGINCKSLHCIYRRKEDIILFLGISNTITYLCLVLFVTVLAGYCMTVIMTKYSVRSVV